MQICSWFSRRYKLHEIDTFYSNAFHFYDVWGDMRNTSRMRISLIISQPIVIFLKDRNSVIRMKKLNSD